MARHTDRGRFHFGLARSPATKVASGPKSTTVSASGIFKKKPAKTKAMSKGHRRKECTPELELAVAAEGGLEDAAKGISTNTTASYNEIYAIFAKRLAKSNMSSSVFENTASQATAELTEPLTRDAIQTTKNPNGTRTTKITEIGDRIALFRELVKKESAKLNEHWKEWDYLQQEIEQLGIGVFGAKAFGADNLEETGDERSFKGEVKLIGIENNTWMEELIDEIEQMGAKALEKMKASEKELEVAENQEREELLRSILT